MRAVGAVGQFGTGRLHMRLETHIVYVGKYSVSPETALLTCVPGQVTQAWVTSGRCPGTTLVSGYPFHVLLIANY